MYQFVKNKLVLIHEQIIIDFLDSSFHVVGSSNRREMKMSLILCLLKRFSNSLIIHKVNYKSLHVYHITCMCLDTQ